MKITNSSNLTISNINVRDGSDKPSMFMGKFNSVSPIKVLGKEKKNIHNRDIIQIFPSMITKCTEPTRFVPKILVNLVVIQ